MKNTILVLGGLSLFGSYAFAFTHVTADITTNTNWTLAGSPYVLEHIIHVQGGVALDIAPGVVVRGQPRSSAGAFDSGVLVVTTGAKIQARGTAAQPIIFTTAAIDSGRAVGGAATGLFLDANADGIADRWSAANGDEQYLDLNPATAPLKPINPNNVKNTNLWGGLIVAGGALTNRENQVDLDQNGTFDGFLGLIEGLGGGNAIYGGWYNVDWRAYGILFPWPFGSYDSGILRYVSIRHGGTEIAAGHEMGALNLYAVGDSTIVNHLDVYATGADGIKIHGGSVNLSNLNINYAGDDGLDIDEGYTGHIQYVLVLQGLGYGDSGLELEGEDKALGYGPPAGLLPYPMSDASIYNATILMDTANNAGGSSGVHMRAGFAGRLANSIIVNTASTAAGTGVLVDGLAPGETEPSAQTQYAYKRLQIRNNTINGFALPSTTFVADLALEPSPPGPVSFTPHLNIPAATTGFFTVGKLYPTTLNRTFPLGMIPPNHDAINGVNPRPSVSANAGAYGSTQDPAYVPLPSIKSTAYKGAFDRTASNLWISAWTALSIRGVLN
jgi:hypothetical protein